MGASCNVPVNAWQAWCCLHFLEIAMKTIVSALIALSVLAGIAAPASAMDAKTFYEQQDRVSY
jgi:hypothetical protein